MDNTLKRFTLPYIYSFSLFCYNDPMVITYYGLSCFKIQSGDTVLAVDPYSKESGLTPPRFEAHAVFSTHNHDNHNNIEALSSKEEGGVFKITGPGEYEFRGIKREDTSQIKIQLKAGFFERVVVYSNQVN